MAGPPGKDFLDPLRLRFLLGSLSLLEIQRQPLRFRYRLVGTDIVQRPGMELTGKWLDDHPERPFVLICSRARPWFIARASPAIAAPRPERWEWTGCWNWWRCPCLGPMARLPISAPARVFRLEKSDLPIGRDS